MTRGDKGNVAATDIDWEVQGRVAIIRIRGGRLNVYQRQIHERLCRAMLRFLRDDSLHVAVLTSAPGQSWSAGDDISEFDLPFGDEPDWAEVLALTPRDKPVVAAVRGYCLGQGLSYLLRLTDIRYATPDAQFGFPEIKYGMGGAGDSSGLTRAIPASLARYHCLTGDPIDAETALRTYLVNALTPDDALETKAIETAKRIAAHPLAALRAEMSPVARSLGASNPFAQTALFNVHWQAYEADRENRGNVEG
ncbi:enoyl-CoA hydratase/isomerase family protein [Phenylobacterium montanum]|uniref:Enoyl-CoA hydratase/isomerase family protein n=1 Tax=Phenylobacterium montanum TaxID=2823693 RepID=A0A975G2S2_9CAUL|nr:enoyl-CoA hydratase/isomerase family protein [Caulobacter sp. S6]QUD89830.1 enoyl-CoA hydratase/isomerase family protein [Caulobacter sp. S6]